MLAKADQIQHSSIYWNPTTHNIKVEALGIIKTVGPDQKCTIWDYVEPGGRISIPWGLAIGGKRSALKSVAPQLILLKKQEGTDEYDTEISPLTYNERCAFCDGLKLSSCCHRQVLWSEGKRKLICQRCQK